jgi:hypothetical protein
MEYLVLGPASMGVFAIVGSLIKYEAELKNIKEISGASAGAVIGVGLALNIPLPDILDGLLSIDIENLSKFNLRCFMSTYGLIDLKPVRKALVTVYGCDPTFSELHKKLYISSYCLNRIFLCRYPSRYESLRRSMHEYSYTVHRLIDSTQRYDLHGWVYPGIDTSDTLYRQETGENHVHQIKNQKHLL